MDSQLQELTDPQQHHMIWFGMQYKNHLFRSEEMSRRVRLGKTAWQNLNFDNEHLFGFETLVFATSGILSMHNQLETLQREKLKNRIIKNLKSHHMTPLSILCRIQIGAIRFVVCAASCMWSPPCYPVSEPGQSGTSVTASVLNL